MAKGYKKKKFFWGLKLWPGLKKVLKYTPTGKALDIGAGEGKTKHLKNFRVNYYLISIREILGGVDYSFYFQKFFC